jgi:hypothetical protein
VLDSILFLKFLVRRVEWRPKRAKCAPPPSQFKMIGDIVVIESLLRYHFILVESDIDT